MKNIIDNIVSCLENEQIVAKFANLSKRTKDDFFSNNFAKKSSKNSQQPPQTNNNVKKITDKSISNIQENKNIPIAQIKPINISQYDNLTSLETYLKKCNGCERYLCRNNLVFGSGNPNADLMFIGETPKEMEDNWGKTFIGQVGDKLTDMINAMKVGGRDSVYITNIVKCYSEKNLKESQVQVCKQILDKQIELIKPKVLVLLGNIPLRALFKESKISTVRGNWHNYKGIKTMPTFHPAYIIRKPLEKKYAWTDLQRVMKELGV